jgi:hypothetical protein
VATTDLGAPSAFNVVNLQSANILVVTADVTARAVLFVDLFQGFVLSPRAWMFQHSSRAVMFTAALIALKSTHVAIAKASCLCFGVGSLGNFCISNLRDDTMNNRSLSLFGC